MGQGNSVPRVSGGIPPWLWLGAVTATGLVVFGILVEQSGPSPDEIWAKAVAHSTERDKNLIEEDLEALRQAGGDPDRIKVLEGIVNGASNRDPRAIETLTPYLEHDDLELRQLATKFSAMSYQRIGNSVGAEKLYQANIEMAPDNVLSHLLLMQLYEQAGALVPAAKVAEDVLQLDPENSLAAALIPAAYRDSGQLEEAITAYQTLLGTESAIVSADPDVLTDYLKCLMAAGREAEAAEFLKTNSEYVTDLSIGMDVFLKNGMVDEAEEILFRADEATRKKYAQSSQIQAARVSNPEEAIAILQKVAMLNPRSPGIYEQLAEVATAAGQNEVAKTCQENLRRLSEIRQRIADAVAAIGSNLDSPDLRIAVAELQLEVWGYVEATEWLSKASFVAGPRQPEVTKLRASLQFPSSLLIPFASWPSWEKSD